MAAVLLSSPRLGPPPRLSNSVPHHSALHLSSFKFNPPRTTSNSNPSTRLVRFPNAYCYTSDSPSISSPPSDSSAPIPIITPLHMPLPAPVKKKRNYRKMYPGEMEGITEEMRFVAMRLRKKKSGLRSEKSDKSGDGEMEIDSSGDSGRGNHGRDDDDDDAGGTDSMDDKDSGGGDTKTWQPSMEGFLKYLVDSELVFGTIERIVDESQDASYTYFRKTGLERSESIRKDLEWFSRQNIPIPEPSNPGKTYVKHLEELAEENSPLFLCHLYNIYFSHIAGGQVIVKQVSERLLEGRELELCRWQGDPEVLLNGVRGKLNALGEYWPRRQKCKCLRESKRAFQYLGEIVRLIIL